MLVDGKIARARRNQEIMQEVKAKATLDSLAQRKGPSGLVGRGGQQRCSWPGTGMADVR